jgi:hypothetical protein
VTGERVGAIADQFSMNGVQTMAAGKRKPRWNAWKLQERLQKDFCFLQGRDRFACKKTGIGFAEAKHALA